LLVLGLQKYVLRVHFQDNVQIFPIFFNEDQFFKSRFITFSLLFQPIFFMNNFFSKSFLLRIISISWSFTLHAQTQKQDFESPFSPKSIPEEFLPGWFGNEVRSTASRIFQALNLGRGGSHALAVQPLSSFNGEIWIKLHPSSVNRPRVGFWARSLKNGTGNRATEVYISWGETLTGPFNFRSLLGGEKEFPNENQEFRKYYLFVPDEIAKQEEVYVKIEIKQSSGTGTSARWVLDDFELTDWIQDVSPPRLLGIKGYSKDEICLTFNEALDPVFSLFPRCYQLEDRKVDNVKALNDSTVIVRFDKSFEEKNTFSIRLSQIPDIEGNELKDTTIHFVFTDPTSFEYKSLVINELMPSPRSDQDLPNVEYVELVNPTEKELRLEGLLLSNSKTSTILPEFWIQPGAHVILAPANQFKLLSEFGQVVPINPWPTLLNSGEVVSLSSKDYGQIDQLGYATSSWGGSEFATGGYSLEVVNPFYLCDNSELLKPSKDLRRGTPGRQNSVFSKEVKKLELAIESTIFSKPNQLELVFNQPLISKIKANQVTITPEISVDSIWTSLSGKKLHMRLSQAVKQSLIYEVTLSEFVTCAGQFINGIIRVSVVLPEDAKPGDLIINEVLFDPRAGDPKFVEIHNLSDRYLSMHSWALANLDKTGKLDQVRVFGGNGSYFEPRGFLAITTDSNSLVLSYPRASDGKFLRIASLPSYPIGGGTVVLLSPAGQVEDRFSYGPKLHHPLIRNSKGVSLERISGRVPTENSSNWQSASSTEGYATPGKKNSVAQSGEFESNKIQIDPPVFDPEGSIGPNFTTIRYELDQSGWVGSFSIYSATGLLIANLAQNQILGTTGLLTWSGTDLSGARVRVGYYVLLVELFDLSGRISVIKKTIAIGSRL